MFLRSLVASVARMRRRLNGAHRLYKADKKHASVSYTCSDSEALYVASTPSLTANQYIANWGNGTYSNVYQTSTSTTYTWPQLTNLASTGITNVSVYNNAVWAAWTQNYQTDTTTYLNTSQANYQTPREAPHFNKWLDGVWARKNQRARTAAQLEESARLAKEREQQRFRDIKEREQADKRAVELLRNALTEEQRREYDTLKYFHVTTKSGRRYKIGSTGVVTLEHNGSALERWCLHVGLSLPIADDMLGKKLWLETDELEVRRIANITDMRTNMYAARNSLNHLPAELQAA